jgi:hypothetical protein
MAEELRVGGVVGGWALPVRPPARLDRAGLVVARLAAARGVLVRAVLRPRDAVLRGELLARAAGSALAAEAAGVAAGDAAVAGDGVGLGAAAFAAVAAGTAGDAVEAAGDAGGAVAAGTDGVVLAGASAPAELLEGVAAMREVLVRLGVRLAMGGEGTGLGAGRAEAR